MAKPVMDTKEGLDTRQGTVITHCPGISRGLVLTLLNMKLEEHLDRCAGGEAIAPFTQDSSETAGDRA